jgi:predicted enzyme related to lactoylglutathione lyase
LLKAAINVLLTKPEDERFMLTTHHDATFEEIISILKESPMSNPFCHVELNTNDVKKAKDFYGRLFDWKLEDIPSPGGGYTMIAVGEGTGGGLMKNPIPGAPSFWLSYVLVDDIEAATKKAKSLGAQVMKDVTPVMDFGWLSIITDPTGATLGLWKPKKA